MTATMRDAVSPDLRTTLRALKLGQMLATLPDRLTLARQQKMTHADFLELVLADEHARREAKSASLRARAAGLDAGMRLDTWDETAAITYDRQLWNELTSLRFLDGPHGALLLGPVGVGKTHLACALGHIAIRRRRTVHMAPAAKLLKRLRAARLDNTLDAEMRRLASVDLLILDLSRCCGYPDRWRGGGGMRWWRACAVGAAGGQVGIILAAWCGGGESCLAGVRCSGEGGRARWARFRGCRAGARWLGMRLVIGVSWSGVVSRRGRCGII
jgi:hypothetical protein